MNKENKLNMKEIKNFAVADGDGKNITVITENGISSVNYADLTVQQAQDIYNRNFANRDTELSR